MTRLDKLLAVCNAVREAGGGDTIEALLPSTPGNQKACLIARNLNFNCQVFPVDDEWVMVASKAILEKVAPALGPRAKVKQIDVAPQGRRVWAVKLPAWMGKMAQDFDNAVDPYETKHCVALLQFVTLPKLRKARKDVRHRLANYRRWQAGLRPICADDIRSMASLEAKLTQAIEARKR